MFEVHRLNDTGMKKAEQLQVAFKEFLLEIEDITSCPPGRGDGAREMAIVRTHLETASFYAKRAMAVQPENHDAVIG